MLWREAFSVVFSEQEEPTFVPGDFFFTTGTICQHGSFCFLSSTLAPSTAADAAFIAANPRMNSASFLFALLSRSPFSSLMSSSSSVRLRYFPFVIKYKPGFVIMVCQVTLYTEVQ